MADLGITRLARQTGLDRIGIPVWAAMRPNSLSLAVNQGKGIDDDAARASALMEAAEYAIAERPDAAVFISTKADLLARGERVFEPTRQMAGGASVPDRVDLPWLKGRQLLGGEAVWVPLEATRLDHTRRVFGGLSRSSNGLASGNDEDEATLHAVCELIERDAKTLLTFRSDRGIAQRQVDPASFGSRTVDRLRERLCDAGFHLALFDLTTEIGVPAFQAVIRDARLAARHQFDLSAGAGCHPFAAHAAVRAITEAAQTRITNISGARDDIDPGEYREPLRDGLGVYLDAANATSFAPLPGSVTALDASPRRMLEAVAARLDAAGITDIPVVRLGGARQEISIVKVFAPLLEDRPANVHWTPGPRVANAMLRLW